MAGQVQAADLLFHLQQFAGGVLGHRRHLVLVGLRLAARHQSEEVDLAVEVVALVVLDAFEDGLDALQHTAAGRLQPVEGAGADQAFDGAAVEFGAAQPLAEIVQPAKRPLLPLGHHRLDQVAADVFDRVEAKTDGVAVDGEAPAGDVDVGRQHLDAQALAFGRVLDDLGGVVQHAGQQRGHELARVMAFEVGGPEGHIGVAGGVRFVEGVGGEADHLVVDRVGGLLGNAVFDAAGAFAARLGAAVDEMFALGLHHLVLFLAHGAADVVGLAVAEAGQLAADLHDLLLIDDAAVGHVQDMRQLGGLVLDLVRLAPVAQVGGDGIHRPGAVERDEGDDIFKVFGAQADKDLLHAGGFQLEHALGLAVGQHGVGGGVVVIDAGEGKLRCAALDRHFGIVDDGEGAQAQKIHLEQAQALDLGHIELGHRQAVVGGQRHILGGRFPRDDDAGRMGGGMPGHALDADGGVDQLVDLLVVFVELFQVGRDFQRMAERHFQLHGDQLGHLVHVLVGQAHDTPHVPHRVAGGHGAEGDDLRHMVPAVFLVDVVDDFLPALVAEVHVKVGHRNALRVQKTLEDQVVADGVNVGDAHAVGRQAAGAGAAARPHRDAPAFGVVDKIVDDQVIVGVPHRLDDVDLVFQAVLQLPGDLAGVAAFQALAAEHFKIILVVHAVRRFEVGQLGVAELKVEIAQIGDLVGILAGFGHH